MYSRHRKRVKFFRVRTIKCAVAVPVKSPKIFATFLPEIDFFAWQKSKTRKSGAAGSNKVFSVVRKEKSFFPTL